MFTTSSTRESDASLAELIRFSSKAAQKKPLRSLKTPPSPKSQPDSHLMPLRERDVEVLSNLFMQDEIEDIEADILHNLHQRYPEPCWEDDPLDFLQEYL